MCAGDWDGDGLADLSEGGLGNPPPVAAGDLDGDGDDDLVVASPYDWEEDAGVVWRVDLEGLLGG